MSRSAEPLTACGLRLRWLLEQAKRIPTHLPLANPRRTPYSDELRTSVRRITAILRPQRLHVAGQILAVRYILPTRVFSFRLPQLEELEQTPSAEPPSSAPAVRPR